MHWIIIIACVWRYDDNAWKVVILQRNWKKNENRANKKTKAWSWFVSKRIVSLERRISLLKVSYQIYFQTLFFIPHLSGAALHN